MKIGFIGLGIMGKPMAKNLLKAGYTDLLVNNRSQAPVQELEAAGATGATQQEIGEQFAGNYHAAQFPSGEGSYAGRKWRGCTYEAGNRIY